MMIDEDVTYARLSKVYRACGYRVGWVSFSGILNQSKDYLLALDLLAGLRLCSNVPGQWAVQTALGGHQSVRQLCAPGGRLYESRQAVAEGVERSAFLHFNKPRGAMYAFIGVDSNIVKGFQVDDKNYIGVSGGVEPIFALYYTRRTESFKKTEFYKVFHSTVQAYIDKMNLQEEIEAGEKVEDVIPDHFRRTAHHINPDKRVAIQGKIQKYIDHSISSTINLPEDVQPELISDIYIQAWKNKLKGVTIYRDGSRFPILSTEGELTEFQENKDKKFVITNDAGEELEVNGDDIMKLPDGSLVTMYHYLKNSNKGIEEVLSNTKFEDAVSD